jgi:hypothetical protein
MAVATVSDVVEDRQRVSWAIKTDRKWVEG